MHLNDEQRKIGKENFQHAAQQLNSAGLTRREFVAAGVGAGLTVPTVGLGGFYFGYSKVKNPVRVGVIGTGDEGSVLLHNLNPNYMEVKAIADLRPYNVWRAFNGQPGAEGIRQGLMKVYGWATEDEARKNVDVYAYGNDYYKNNPNNNGTYEDLLKRDDIEAVIIAVPLHLHAPMAIAAMNARKHVLTEKLMAKTVGDCKKMWQASNKNDVILATGHQRHYSVLYENAVAIIRHGLLGDLHHIRAQWHRGNLPGKDSWMPPLPTDPGLAKEVEDIKRKLEANKKAGKADAVARYQDALAKKEQYLLDAVLGNEENLKKLAENGFPGFKINGTGAQVDPLEALIRWRLWNQSGGGLMAELGSHQLDAASIFLSAMRADGAKVKPLSVMAAGGRHLFPEDRECDDHVYCTYEFPGPEMYESIQVDGKPLPGYPTDPEKKVVVTYSSINGNGFGDWGEVVLGTQGSMVLDKEQEVMLYGDRVNSYVKVDTSNTGATMTSSGTGWSGGGGGSSATSGGGTASWASGNVSRGYKEEMEHFAYCIRNRAPENQVRCGPDRAMADAVIALTANISMSLQKRIEFKEEWFQMDHPAVPEDELKNAGKLA